MVGRKPKWLSVCRVENPLEKRVREEVNKDLELYYNGRDGQFEFWYKGKKTGRWYMAMRIPDNMFNNPTLVIRHLKRCDLQRRDLKEFMQELKKSKEAVEKAQKEELDLELFNQREEIVKDVEKGFYDNDGIRKVYYPENGKVESKVGASK